MRSQEKRINESHKYLTGQQVQHTSKGCRKLRRDGWVIPFKKQELNVKKKEQLLVEHILHEFTRLEGTLSSRGVHANVLRMVLR